MPRTLVLCFDGTGDSFDDDCTNVVRFVESLEKRRPDKQLYYYQPGIGIAKKLDQAFAWYLDAHVGLLPKSNEEHLGFAYRKYLDHTPKGKKDAQAFKRAFSIAVPIEFVGVWDTVASVGWTFKHLPFTDSNTIIRNFRHALALDERRVEFRPNPWHYGSNEPNAAKHDPEGGTATIGSAKESKLPGTVQGWLSFPKQIFNTIFRRTPVDSGGTDTLENDTDDDFEYHFGEPTSIKEVWFAGCHADVGGGSTPNDDIHTLANPSLQWMVSQVLAHVPELLFRSDAFTYDKAFSTLTTTKSDKNPKPARPRIPSTFRRAAAPAGSDSSPTPTPLPPMTAATAGSSPLNGAGAEEEEQTVVAVLQTDPDEDANAKLYDQLSMRPVWLILEYVPRFQYYQDGKGVWHWRFRWNASRPREIYADKINVHKSVKLRENYKWQAKFIPNEGKQLAIEYVE
ncbi:hypothetical protein FRC01_008851 [Tulasnella sp. 417]|nr:hypothetical protein FRC01_008851 [Tulasnella sp. 417]